MTLKTDVDKTKADAEVVEADVDQDVKDAEAEAVATVQAVTKLAKEDAEKVVWEVRKILGLPTTVKGGQHVNGTSDRPPLEYDTPLETADQPKHYEPERSPANQPVSPADQPADPAVKSAKADGKSRAEVAKDADDSRKAAKPHDPRK